MPVESELERDVVRKLRAIEGVWVSKNLGGNGIPDRILCIAGQFVGIEFKSMRGRQNKAQSKMQDKIRVAGGKYILCSPLYRDSIIEAVRKQVEANGKR